MSLEELLKKMPKERAMGRWGLARYYEEAHIWFKDFEAFVANFNKALQSKDLAYKTMEKAYIRLSKKLDGLRKLRNDMQQRLDYYENKPYASCAQDELEKFIRRLDAQLGDLEK